jgi:hypothetical protein
MEKIIRFQQFLSPDIVPVLDNKDYAHHKRLLEHIDRILNASGVEFYFIRLSTEQFESRAKQVEASGERALSGPDAIARHQQRSSQALRCMVLRNLIGADYRELSQQLAMCELYQWFCRVQRVPVVRAPSKSTLNDYATWLPAEQMKMVLDTLSEAVRDEARAKIIGLEHELDMGVVWVDTTCLKANIHFPVDWVLLRDGVRSLVANIETIRSHGLHNRIAEPESFLRQINALCMAMTAGAGKKTDGKTNRKKARKKIFREMKALCTTVLKHAERYRSLLDECWEKTDLSRPEAEVILRRMDNVIAQLPEAQRQAHERVIGGRQVPSKEKILSLYESDIHVIVRGKAGAAVEFGNTLFIGENADGYILDHDLMKESSRGDAKCLGDRYPEILEKSGGTLCGLVGDRGFESRANRKMLDADEVFNGLCPRNPVELAQRMEEDEAFAGALRRRGQTEGRVGILKNVFLDGTPRAKGFENRQLQVAWAVLAHNLWVVARLPWIEKKIPLAEAA